MLKGIKKTPRDISYTPTTAGDNFHSCNLPIRLLFSGVGTGKSVTCLWEIFIRATLQEPVTMAGAGLKPLLFVILTGISFYDHSNLAILVPRTSLWKA